MSTGRSSIFAFASGRHAKWVVLGVWFAAMALGLGLQLPAKFKEAESNESTSFLPGEAESTVALRNARRLQGGELAPAAIVYRRESGLTEGDRRKIASDVRRMARKRFEGAIADGATAASGGRSADSDSPQRGPGSPAAGESRGCAGPTTAIQGQPDGYSPFVGPICSPDGKAAIVTAYVRGNGESETLLDPVEYWRATVSDPGGGLEVKVTGGAGYAAEAIKVFESINGTLLLAAVTLVVVLLILIYRSPIFLFIPLAAVVFAELLTNAVGYGLTELGVTINGQSSSIMSVLVLGAGTDYALLVAARYREELRQTDDRHVAIAAAMRSAGPAVLASAATVIAGLLCLSIADVDGTAGLGPIGALGVACAALSMLTLLPALLTIFGRRAFWPFVPHTETTIPSEADLSEEARASIVEGSRGSALGRALAASLLVALPPVLVVVLLNALVRRVVALLSRGGVRLPSLILGPLDRNVFTPYEVRRRRRERPSDATHGFWKRVGDRVASGPRRVMFGSIAVLLVMTAGLAFFSTNLTENDSYRDEVEAVAGQELLSKSFPAGASVPTELIVEDPSRVASVVRAVRGVEGVESVSPPVAQGEGGLLLQATLEPDPYSTEALDLIVPIRKAASSAAPGTLVGGPTAIRADSYEAAARDSTVIPPIVLVVVFLILVLLLRAVIAPLLLVGTVILSFLASLGVGYLVFDVVFGFPGSDPSLPLFAFVFLVALGVDYNIFLVARAREETLQHGTREGMLRALAVTGGVITSAGIVLAGTFSVLAVLPLVFLTEIGFVVAFGVLLDTFLVRSVLVPALFMQLGSKVWWPSSLAREDGSAGWQSPGPRDAGRPERPAEA